MGMMHELLEGSEVVDRVCALLPELTELEKLRLRSQERAYQRSVEHLRPIQKSRQAAEDNDLSGFKWATNFGLQVIVAFIGAFALGYYFIETFVAPDNATVKVLTGLGCSIFTLILEVTLFMVHEQKEEMIKKKRKVDEYREMKSRNVEAREKETSAEAKNEAIKPAEEKKED